MAAQENTLEVGQGRLGWMVDGNPRTPETATWLWDDGQQITLTVPWPPGHHDNPYERWFTGSTHFGDDPDRTRFDYRVPEILWFEDSHGPVALVGCRSAGSHRQMISGAGKGVVTVTFAVIGGRADYRKINGLRTELPGLADWINLRSITKHVRTDDHHRVLAVEIKAEAPEPIPLDRTLNVSIRPNWSTGSERDSMTVRDALLVETLVTKPRSWEEHLGIHNTVRDLLDVAAWRPHAYSAYTANRADDPHETLSGRVVEPRWATVLTRRLRQPGPSDIKTDFLFTFADIGAAGYRRWAQLRSRFRRGIDPMLGLLDLQGARVEVPVAQSGLALEAIALELALEAGVSRKKANDESHEDRLKRIATSLPPDLFAGIVDDLDEWAERSKDVYNGVKHANRKLPEVLTLANTERENELIFRAWVAIRLGVVPSELHSRLKRDPLASPYSLA